MTDLAQAADSVVLDRVLVSGSPPPHGRDLDLVCRPAEEEALAAWLRDEGFLEHGGEWVRFRNGTVEALDLIPASDWDLPAAETEALFAEARPLEGYERLVRPAPRHLVLMLARRLIQGDGVLDEKRLARLETALEEEDGAWQGAREAAPRWGLSRGVTGLRLAYETGAAMPESERAAAIAERLRARGTGSRRARLEGWRSARRPEGKPGGPLISFSGLDGAGKSSQAESLKRIFERLGYDSELVWTRLEWTTLWENPILGWVAWPLATAAALAERIRGRKRLQEPVAPTADHYHAHQQVKRPGTRLRQKSGLLSAGWVGFIALAHARAQRAATAPLLRAGKAVVCDRYTLDAAVHLRLRYGAERSYRRQIRLLERLSPRPLLAFFVDVPAETALARKSEQFTLDELRRHRELYREEAAALGVAIVDGERPPEELSAEIGERVWRAVRRV